MAPRRSRARSGSTGACIDGAGDPLDDALIEIWQANRAGRYRHPEDDRDELPLDDGFIGFGRCPTDAEGHFRFVTVKPGASRPRRRTST